MDDTLQKAYEQLEEDIRTAMKAHRGNKSLMSILLNTLLLYPDHPYDFDEIRARAYDPQTKEYVKFLVTEPENLTRKALYAKERALIADVKEELRCIGRGSRGIESMQAENASAGKCASSPSAWLLRIPPGARRGFIRHQSRRKINQNNFSERASRGLGWRRFKTASCCLRAKFSKRRLRRE
jgi:hypothetical protein